MNLLMKGRATASRRAVFRGRTSRQSEDALTLPLVDRSVNTLSYSLTVLNVVDSFSRTRSMVTGLLLRLESLFLGLKNIFITFL